MQDVVEVRHALRHARLTPTQRSDKGDEYNIRIFAIS